ncbi:MAG: DUF2715 domain-containing protein [Treponema sp.]
MKKICGILCAALLMTAHSFAELVVSPSIGLSHLNIFAEYPLKDLYKSENLNTKATVMRSLVWTPMTFGMDLRYVSPFGLLIGFDNYFSMLGSMDFKSEMRKTSDPAGTILKPLVEYEAHAKNVKGFFWDSNIVGGFSIKAIPRLRLNLELGLGVGVGKLNAAIKTSAVPADVTTDIMLFTAGIPVRVDLQYFFIKDIGIQLSACDVPSFGFATIEDKKSLSRLRETGIKQDNIVATGFANILRITLGPVFKL